MMPIREVSDTTSEINQLAVQITIRFTNGITTTGSGFLLNGDTILTAAHVVDDYYEVTSGVFAQGVIDYIRVTPALDDTPPAGGSSSPYGQHLADLTSLQFWPGYVPNVISNNNSALDIAVFQLSGPGISSSSIDTSHYIGLSAFYALGAAAGWQVAMMGYPAIGSYDGGNMYVTDGTAELVGLPGSLVGLIGSTAHRGQSGSGLVANIENLVGLQTGTNLPNSFIYGVLNANNSTNVGVGAYFTRAHLDWILTQMGSGGSAADLPMIYHFGSDSADNIAATTRRDYMLGGNGIDTLSGGDADDVLYGEGDNDTLSGGAGNDFLDGGAGTNTLDGGADSDTVSFRSLASGLTVTYASGALTHNAANQTLTGIENLLLTDHVDTVTLTNTTGLIGTLGGPDNIYISTWDFANGAPGTVYLSPGDGNDTIYLPNVIPALRPDVVLIGGDAGDQLIFNGVNLASLIASANVHTSDANGSYWALQMEIPPPTEWSPPNYLEWTLSISWNEAGIVTISYRDDEWDISDPHYPSNLGHIETWVRIVGFQTGDYGFTASPPTTTDPRQALEDDATDQGLTSILGALQNDHVWAWIGAGSWVGTAAATSGADQFAGVASADNASGLAGNDTLNGNGGNDTLSGDAGDDQLNGGVGNDLLAGGANADALDGGAGADTAVYALASSSATWSRTPDGNWTVSAGAEGTDSLTSVEMLQFTDRTVFLDSAPQTFTGDGTSDLLLRNTTNNALNIRFLSGTTVSDQNIGSIGGNWTPQSGDFNGDGRDDILWRDSSSGAMSMWFMNGGSVSAVSFGSATTNWVIEGLGDFNGDGRDDMLWRNSTTGDMSLWFLNGAAVTPGSFGNVGAGWVVGGLGDFNGDGRDDILWRNTSTGATNMWFMNGLAVTAAAVSTVASAWVIAGAGEFNGDGRDDILWRNTSTGDVSIWFMNGASVAGSAGFGIATTWALEAVGDYNGNGTDDLIWRNASGDVVAWYINGASVTGASLGTLSSDWVINPGG